jgi:hypothetical protein
MSFFNKIFGGGDDKKKQEPVAKVAPKAKVD